MEEVLQRRNKSFIDKLREGQDPPLQFGFLNSEIGDVHRIGSFRLLGEALQII